MISSEQKRPYGVQRGQQGTLDGRLEALQKECGRARVLYYAMKCAPLDHGRTINGMQAERERMISVLRGAGASGICQIIKHLGLLLGMLTRSEDK